MQKLWIDSFILFSSDALRHPRVLLTWLAAGDLIFLITFDDPTGPLSLQVLRFLFLLFTF